MKLVNFKLKNAVNIVILEQILIAWQKREF